MKKTNIGIIGNDSNLIVAIASALMSKGKSTVCNSQLPKRPTNQFPDNEEILSKLEFRPDKSAARTNKFFSVKKRYRKA